MKKYIQTYIFGFYLLFITTAPIQAATVSQEMSFLKNLTTLDKEIKHTDIKTHYKKVRKTLKIHLKMGNHKEYFAAS